MHNISGMNIHMQRRKPQRLRLARFTQPLEMRQPKACVWRGGLLPVLFKQGKSVIRQPRRGWRCR
jgi:hypothetical protein